MPAAPASIPSVPSFASDDVLVESVTTRPAIATAGAALNRPAKRLGFTASLTTANARTRHPPAAARIGIVSQSLMVVPKRIPRRTAGKLRQAESGIHAAGPTPDTVRRAVTTHPLGRLSRIDDQARSQSRYPPHPRRDRVRGTAPIR